MFAFKHRHQMVLSKQLDAVQAETIPTTYSSAAPCRDGSDELVVVDLGSEGERPMQSSEDEEMVRHSLRTQSDSALASLAVPQGSLESGHHEEDPAEMWDFTESQCWSSASSFGPMFMVEQENRRTIAWLKEAGRYASSSPTAYSSPWNSNDEDLVLGDEQQNQHEISEAWLVEADRYSSSPTPHPGTNTNWDLDGGSTDE